MKGSQQHLLTLQKSKSIQGAKVSEITVQGAAAHGSSNASRLNLELLSPQAVASILAQSPMYTNTSISTPQKFRLKTQQKKHGGSVLKPSTQSVGSSGPSLGGGHGPTSTAKRQMASLSKGTSEKRLGTSVGGAESDSRAAYARCSPRNQSHAGSQGGDEKPCKGGRTQAAGKKHASSSSQGGQHHSQQASLHSQQYISEYLASGSKAPSHAKHGSVSKDSSKAKKLSQGHLRHAAKSGGAQLQLEPSASVLVQSKALSNPVTNRRTAAPSAPATTEQTPGEVREPQTDEGSLELHQVHWNNPQSKPLKGEKRGGDLSPPVQGAVPSKAPKQPQHAASNLPEHRGQEDRAMFRISNNPDLTLKAQHQRQLCSGPSFPSNDSGELPNITSIMSQEKLGDDEIQQEIKNDHYEDDDYEVVMAEEVEDNLIFSNRADLEQEKNELDEATISYNEVSGDYSASLAERSGRKHRRQHLPSELYAKKNGPSNQKQPTFKPDAERRASKVKSLAIPDSFDIDTSIYNARTTQGQPPPRAFNSNTSNASAKNSANAKTLNNLILGGQAGSAASAKNQYAKTFHSNVYTNVNVAPQFHTKFASNNSNSQQLSSQKSKGVAMGSPGIFKGHKTQALGAAESTSSVPRPGSQSMSYIPPRRLNDQSITHAGSSRPDDLSQGDERVFSQNASPDPIRKGLKAQSKEKTLRRITMGQMKDPLARAGAYTHFQSSAEMLSSFQRSQGNAPSLQAAQKRKTSSQSRSKQRELSVNTIQQQQQNLNIGGSLVSQFAKKVSTQQAANVSAIKQMQQREAKLREKTKKNLKQSTQLTLEKHSLKRPAPSTKEGSSVAGSMSTGKKSKFEFNIGVGSHTPQQHLLSSKLLDPHKQKLLYGGNDRYSSTQALHFASKRRSIQTSQKKGSVTNLHALDQVGESGADGKQSSRFSKAKTGSRKWAHSLTDKYRGDQIEKVITGALDQGPSQMASNQRQRLVFSGSRVSSSGGSASNLIPSESERYENNAQHKSHQGIKAFFPDPKGSHHRLQRALFERKRSSCDKPPTSTTSQQHLPASVGMSRASSKHTLIEPHRMVKVSKPISQATFVAKRHIVQKNKQMQQNLELLSGKKRHTAQKFQSLIEPTQRVSKKSGSFGGSCNEPSVPMTPSMMSQSAQKTTSMDQNFGMAQAALQQQMVDAAGYQSPAQHSRKQTTFLPVKNQGPGSLIANSNQIRQHSTSVLDQAVAPNQPVGAPKVLLTQLPHEKLKANGSPAKGNVQKRSGAGPPGTRGQLILPQCPQSEKTKKPVSQINYKDLSPEKRAFKNNMLAFQKAQLNKNKDSDQSHYHHVGTQGTDQQRTQNFQMLRQVHGKQITTASKGKDSGNAQFTNVGDHGGKSYSVLVPSAESVAQSKAMMLDYQEKGAGKSSKAVVDDRPADKGRAGKRSFVEQSNQNIAPLSPGGTGNPQKGPLSNKSNKRGPEPGQVAAARRSPREVPLVRVQNQPLPQIEEVQSPNEALEQSRDVKQSFASHRFDQDAALNVIEERIETQDSALSDPSITPRTKIVNKIQKKIKIAFLQTGTAPETQTENYKIGKVMGKGAFGKVNLAIHRLSNKFVALKSINKQFMSLESSKRKVMQEFNMLRRTRHFNIVRLYESFETMQHIVFVMEVCGGGDLLTYVRRRRKLKEDVARHLFRQIVTGMQYCHKKNVLHRDIKLDNILLTSQGDVKICDFGVSKLVTDGELMKEQCGTPAYIAPEVFENKGYEGYQSDVWSAGVVLYAMLYGAVPFKASNMNELHKQVVKCKPTYKDEISKSALDLLQGILTKDPRERLTEEQILEHAWMQDRPAKKVNVFTDSEKDGIISEFEYYNVKKERDLNPNPDESHDIKQTDPFAEQMLSSTQNEDLKNISTRSIILAPFNSTKSQIVLSQYEEFKEMLLPRGQIKFSAKVKEIDRQYELNNNADLDNGVYHQDEDESAVGGTETAGSRVATLHDNTSIATSFNQQQLHSQLDELDAKSNSVNSADLDEDNHMHNLQHISPIPMLSNEKKKEKLSAWRQLEQQMMTEDKKIKEGVPSSSGPKMPEKANEQQKRDEVEQSYEQIQIELFDDDNHNPGEPEMLGATKQERHTFHRQTLIIDESLVTSIERAGYPKPYILASLNSDDLNHTTTFYYLLQTLKEY